ncbi:MAG TPA: type II toxin-antitoxin system RelE/ParE family toxin [Candidatus Yonathbacteria bacterium]|nr:type II toxin-antitoxin system RelE/ParE family toxin [Candidatus Yonathbacteria bacterium]
MKLNIYHHVSSSGRDVIEHYINHLENDIQNVLYALLSKFECNEEFRREPHCKKIGKGIFELRIKVKDHYRILYAYARKDNVIFLHIFKKKTSKIPRKCLELAIKRLKQYEK